jgi:phospholipid-binding lipoprotein MlaA
MFSINCFQQKSSTLLLLLFFFILFNSNKVFSDSEKLAEVPEECYTFSDCQEEVSDPWEGVNRKVFAFNDFLDTYLLKPISQVYDAITPDFIQQGVSNFYKNIKEPITSVNALLQGKGNVSGVSLTRFLINSTLGLGGILDVAGEIGLERFNENFNQTLAVWGVESGNYIVLPFFGSSTVRGGFSLLGDNLIEPLNHYQRGDDGIADPYTAYTNKEAKASSFLQVLKIIDRRASFLDREAAILSGANDKYSFFRRIYFQNLKYQIYDGNVPELENLEEYEDEDLEELLE